MIVHAICWCWVAWDALRQSFDCCCFCCGQQEINQNRFSFGFCCDFLTCHFCHFCCWGFYWFRGSFLNLNWKILMKFCMHNWADGRDTLKKNPFEIIFSEIPPEKIPSRLFLQKSLQSKIPSVPLQKYPLR